MKRRIHPHVALLDCTIHLELATTAIMVENYKGGELTASLTSRHGIEHLWLQWFTAELASVLKMNKRNKKTL